MTLSFAVALAALVAIRLALAVRQIRQVQRHRDAVPAAFAGRIPLAAHQKAADYTVARTRVGLLQTVVGVTLLIIWTWGGGIDLVASWFETMSILQGTAFLLTAGALSVILTLPLDLYRTFVVEEEFGFNRMTPKLFLADLAKGAILLGILGGGAAMGALWLLREGGPYWWVTLWVSWIAFSLLLAWAWPAFIAPLFYNFTPLPDGELRTTIAGLLERTGYKAETISIMDGSRRSAHSNAFFTGFGSNQKVVLFDTLCEQMSTAELEAVLAHEIGHDKHRHILTRMAAGAAQSLIALGAFAWFRNQPWAQPELGVHTGSDATALLLLLWVGPVFAFPLRPFWNHWSRKQEFEADAFAARETSGAAMAKALVNLYESNATTLTPDPLHSAFFDSHPPASLRIGRLDPALK